MSRGVRPKGKNRIEFEFRYKGRRYRPTLLRVPSEANLRRASLQLRDIKERIKFGVFNFREEFPDYRFTDELPEPLPQAKETVAPKARPLAVPKPKGEQPEGKSARTCGEVFDAFLRHCEMRVANNDMAYSTLNGYQKILKRSWRPKLGKRSFKSVVYSELAELAGAQGWKTKKTYNNGISPLRCAFEFGYKDHPDKPNPAAGLDTFRLTKRDCPKIDPFTIQEAETLILGIHVEWGEAIGNFDEFRFFTALRQSEEISLRVQDCDLVKGTIRIHQVVVLGRDKDRPKNNEERIVELCPRALAVLTRQLALRKQYVSAGKINHDFVFFKEDGDPIRCLKYVYTRWVFVVEKLSVRYRQPYNARHTFVSWNLMLGKNLLWCSQQFGHSVQVMLTKYGTWIDGASEADVQLIRQSMDAEATGAKIAAIGSPGIPLTPQKNATSTPLEKG
jgi:integrase